MAKSKSRPSGTPRTNIDMTVRVDELMKKSIVDLARRETNSANAVIRRFIADGLDAEQRKREK